MERKQIELYVPYNDRGAVKEKYYKISFISNRMDREYRSVLTRQQEGLALIKQYETNIQNQGSAIIDKTLKFKERRERVKTLREEAKKIEAKIASFGDSDFFKERVSLIHKILDANGIIDSESMTFEFWDEQVSPGDVVKFLEDAITKDYVEKKKPSSAATMTA